MIEATKACSAHVQAIEAIVTLFAAVDQDSGSDIPHEALRSSALLFAQQADDDDRAMIIYLSAMVASRHR